MDAYKTYLKIEDPERVVLSHLPFQPGQRVEVIILPAAEESEPSTSVSPTAITPPSGQYEGKPISEADFRRLVNRIGPTPDKPLSEIIIEERGPWETTL